MSTLDILNFFFGFFCLFVGRFHNNIISKIRSKTKWLKVLDTKNKLKTMAMEIKFSLKMKAYKFAFQKGKIKLFNN